METLIFLVTKHLAKQVIMLAKRGRRERRIAALTADADWATDHRHFAEQTAAGANPRAAVNGLRISECLADAVDRSSRNARILQLGQPVRRWPGGYRDCRRFGSDLLISG